jgi:hypothetical protein
MTKKKVPQRKQVAPKATNKAKGSSSKAQPKKTNNNRKRPASDDSSSSDEAPEKPHAHSRKKAKKGVEEEDAQLEEEDIEVTVLFRSIRPSRVTRQVVLDEIGCLSHVTRRVVGFEKPLAKWSKKNPFFSSPAGAYVLATLSSWSIFLVGHKSPTNRSVPKLRPLGHRSHPRTN